MHDQERLRVIHELASQAIAQHENAQFDSKLDMERGSAYWYPNSIGIFIDEVYTSNWERLLGLRISLRDIRSEALRMKPELGEIDRLRTIDAEHRNAEFSIN